MPKYLGQCKTVILCAKGALVGVMMNDLVKMHRINSVKICILVTNFYGSFVLYLLHVTLLTHRISRWLIELWKICVLKLYLTRLPLALKFFNCWCNFCSQTFLHIICKNFRFESCVGHLKQVGCLFFNSIAYYLFIVIYCYAKMPVGLHYLIVINSGIFTDFPVMKFH